MQDLAEFIRALPKAELHLHIEGSLEPEMVFALAQKHGVKLMYPSVEALRAAYAFSDLQSFLDIYYAGADVLRDEDDFHAMTAAYLARAHADGVVHAEIFFDPQTHTDRGIALDTVLDGITRALDEARTAFGMTTRLIPCFLRHLSAESAMQTLEAALQALQARPALRRYLVAVGLDSSERGNPPEKFAAVYARARAMGLRAVAHAGEEGPPAYIQAALDVLKVERIDHGVRCSEDPVLVDRLAREQVPLTVCPLSNVKLCVFPHLADHNLRQLLERGLCITLNSDDPAYFGGYVLENYLATAGALQLSRAQIVQLARNSITASFLDPGARQHWLDRIDSLAGDA